MQARKTVYKNVMMRSRLEADTAKFFDRKNVQWLYEPFRVLPPNSGDAIQKNDTGYLPDFQIALPVEKINTPNYRVFVEMKPVASMFPQAFEKMKVLRTYSDNTESKEENVLILICGTALWDIGEKQYNNFYFATDTPTPLTTEILAYLNEKEYTNTDTDEVYEEGTLGYSMETRHSDAIIRNDEEEIRQYSFWNRCKTRLNIFLMRLKFKCCYV